MKDNCTVFYTVSKRDNPKKWVDIVDAFKKIEESIIKAGDIPRIKIEEDKIVLGYTQCELFELFHKTKGVDSNLFPSNRPLKPMGELNNSIGPGAITFRKKNVKRPVNKTDDSDLSDDDFEILGTEPEFSFGSSLKDAVENNNKYRIIIGEEHNNKAPRDQLIEVLNSNNKPDFIGLEFIYHDPHQEILDEWMKRPLDTELPYVLDLFINQRDKEQYDHGQNTSIKEVLFAAKANGVKVVALDSEEALMLQGDERIAALDSLAVDIIEQKTDPKANFILLVGTHHAPAIGKKLNAQTAVFSHNLVHFDLEKNTVSDAQNEIKINHIYDVKEVVVHNMNSGNPEESVPLSDSLCSSSLSLSRSIGIKQLEETQSLLTDAIADFHSVRSDSSRSVSDVTDSTKDLDLSNEIDNSSQRGDEELQLYDSDDDVDDKIPLHERSDYEDRKREAEENRKVALNSASRSNPRFVPSNVNSSSSLSTGDIPGDNNEDSGKSFKFKLIVGAAILLALLAAALAIVVGKSRS